MRAPSKTVSLAGMRSRLLLAGIFLLVLYVLVPQIDSFSASFLVLQHASFGPIAIAAVLVVVSYAVASLTYKLLAFKLLRFGRTFAVQGASAFANRLLPAGLGGLTLNVAYLRRQKHTLPQAVVVAATNNTIGMIGHIVLLGFLLVMGGEEVWSRLSFSLSGTVLYVPLALMLLGVIVVASMRRVRLAARKLGRQLVHALLAYRRRVPRLVAALGSSLVLTTISIAVFYLSGEAVGVSLTFAQVMVVFTVGMLVGTATPTPGGLGGIEAGLVAGSMAYGVDASIALAAALLYRLLSYWAPLAPGFVLFMVIRNRYL